MHAHTDEHTDLSKTEEIFQLQDHVCGQKSNAKMDSKLEQQGQLSWDIWKWTYIPG